MFRSIGGILVLGVLAGSLVGPRCLLGDDEAGENRGPAAALILRLGGASFPDREAAAAELVELGPAVLSELREAADSPDLEIRYRSRQVMDAILATEHAARLQAFLETTESLPDDVLPGWGRYRDEVGDDPEAKKLFVEMQSSERTLFEKVANGGPAATQAYTARCTELNYRYAHSGAKRIPMGSLAAVIYLAGDPSLELGATIKSRITTFCNYNDFRAQLTAGPRSALVRRLLGCWIARADETDANFLYAKTRLAMQYNVPRGLEAALKLLATNQPNYQTQYALLAIGKFGAAEELKIVEGMLKNTTVLSRSNVKNKPPYTCEVRDVALAVALHMTEQSVDPYGFTKLQKQSQYLYMPNSAGFDDPLKREAALERYAQWKAEREAT